MKHYSLITGRSISKPTSSRSLNPSMSGICTSLRTISKNLFLSRNKFKATVAWEQVVTANNFKCQKTKKVRIIKKYKTAENKI